MCYVLVVVRTRNPDVLKECDIVVDVGGSYDINTYGFDWS